MKITIVLLVSRSFLLDKLFERLEELEGGDNLLVLVDGDLNLYLKTRKLVDNSKFNGLCIRAFETSKRGSQQYRRRRVAELHNIASEYLQEAEYIFTIEDDGIIPKDALTKLLAHFKTHPDAGFISGLELGRWISRYIGAWHMTPADNPTEVRSIEYEPDKLLEVTAAGFYCMLVRKELYESHKFSPGPNYGPDLAFGAKITAEGYKNYVDTSIIVDHHTESGRVFNLDNDTPQVVRMVKTNNTWRFIHTVQKS